MLKDARLALHSRKKTRQPELSGGALPCAMKDPVGQVQYTLDPINKVAHRVVIRVQSAEESGGGVAAAVLGAAGNVPRTVSVSPSLMSSESLSAPVTGLSLAPASASAKNPLFIAINTLPLQFNQATYLNGGQSGVKQLLLKDLKAYSAQAERIRHHRHGAEAHRGSSDHRVQE